MAATSPEGKAREKIKSIADATTGFTASRNVLGLDDLSVSTEFLKGLVSSGPYLSIRPARQLGVVQAQCIYNFEIPCDLWFGFAADADYTFETIENLVFTASTGLRSRLMARSNWTGTTPPLGFVSDYPELRTDLKPVVGIYRFTMTFMGAE
jgi:hypothetical protein